jgi:hypothetical protein
LAANDFIPIVDTAGGLNNYQSKKTTVANLVQLSALIAEAQVLLQKGQAGGLAQLGPDGKIPTSLLPSAAIISTTIVGSEADMLALDVQPGDMAVRSDLNKTFVLSASPASTLSNWTEVLSTGTLPPPEEYLDGGNF